MSINETLRIFIADRLARFTGREWVFSGLEKWIQKPTGRRFLLTGGPGSGKSAIAGMLAFRSEGMAQTEPFPALGKEWLSHFHFCQAFNEAALSPLSFVRSLSLALSQRVPGFAEALVQVSDPNITINASTTAGSVSGQVSNLVIQNLYIGNIPSRTAFDQLVRQPLETVYQAGEQRPRFVLVDSLDEALTYGAEDNIAQLLSEFCDNPEDLPASLHFIFTSRPDRRIEILFSAGDLDLIRDAPPDVDDVYNYALARLGAITKPKGPHLAEKIRTESRGNFLYARYVLDDLLAQQELPEDIEALELPPGLEGVYRSFIKRELAKNLEIWEERYRPMMGLLAVARTPGLTRQHLEAVSALPPSRANAVLNLARQYLAGEWPEGPFTLYHQSFRDFLIDDTDYMVYPAEAEQTLASFFLETYGKDWQSCDDEYALRNTPAHLAGAVAALSRSLQHKLRNELLSALSDLLSDLTYLQARLLRESGGTLPLELDLTRAQALLEPGDTQAWLHSMEDALRRESHVLHTNPEMLFVQLYNRLYRGDGSTQENHLTQASKHRAGQPWLRALHHLPIDIAQTRVIDLRSISHMESSEGSPSVNSLTLLEGGSKLLCGSADGFVRLWDLDSGALLSSLKPPHEVSQDFGGRFRFRLRLPYRR